MKSFGAEALTATCIPLQFALSALSPVAESPARCLLSVTTTPPSSAL